MEEYISILENFVQGNFCLVIAKFSNEIKPNLSTFFLEVEKTEFLELKHYRRQAERTATLYLLHHILGIKAALVHHSNGAPYLQGTSVQISISHTEGHIAIVLHQHHKVAIDIERANRNMERVSSRFLSPLEQEFCTSQHHKCLVWCAKETIYKLAQDSNVDFAEHISVQPFNPSSKGIMQGALRQNSNNEVLHQLHYFNVHDLAVVYSSALV
ncbi:MAG: 4'-phosphopantetheinyl transferase family protein [Bacteroidales bacterium]